MNRLSILTAALIVAGSATHAADPLYVSPDVPTTVGAATLLPNEIYRYDAAGPTYTLELTVPGTPNVDAIHKMDEPGDWLFSLDAANDLAGTLAADALPGDVIRYDASAGTYSICFSAASVGLSPQVDVDAVYLEGGDQGDLLASFDVHADLGPFTGPLAFEPGDIVRFAPAGPGVCPGWTLVAANPAFDASAAGTGVPTSTNVEGADGATGVTILALDVPSDLAPPAATYLPGQIVSTDTFTFALFEPLIGWPISSRVNALSCLANPGRVPVTMTVDKSTITAGDLTVTWQPSCSEGGEDYGVFEGTLGVWYSHASVDCDDLAPFLTEEVSPAAGDTYYLVAPHNKKEEGSYGRDYDFQTNTSNERPALGACVSPQVVTPCP